MRKEALYRKGGIGLIYVFAQIEINYVLWPLIKKSVFKILRRGRRLERYSGNRNV